MYCRPTYPDIPCWSIVIPGRYTDDRWRDDLSFGYSFLTLLLIWLLCTHCSRNEYRATSFVWASQSHEHRSDITIQCSYLREMYTKLIANADDFRPCSCTWPTSYDQLRARRTIEYLWLLASCVKFDFTQHRPVVLVIATVCVTVPASHCIFTMSMQYTTVVLVMTSFSFGFLCRQTWDEHYCKFGCIHRRSRDKHLRACKICW